MTPTQNAPILPADNLALISRELVRPIVGMKNSALHERIVGGKFPRPLRLSYRCSRFRAGDIRAWLADPLGWHQGKAIDAELNFSGKVGG
jgi:prophage regulatory protein